MPTSYNYKQPLNFDHRGSRSPGLHLSNVLDVMDEHYNNTRFNDEPLSSIFRNTPTHDYGSNPAIMRVIMGFAWEEWLFKALASPYFVAHPGEWVLDGIIMSPDAVEVRVDLDGSLLLHEVKYTYTSSKTPVVEKRRWMWQAASYLKGMSAHYGELCTDVVMHPYHVCGLGRGIDPIYQPQFVSFEPEEIDMVWQEVQRFKEQAIPETH